MDIRFKGAQRMIAEFAKNGSITRGFEKRMTYAINQSAFGAREGTPDYLRKVLNKPTNFTLRRPLVKKARVDEQVATVQSLDMQDKYLRNLESGGTSEDNRIPFPGTADPYGNLRRKFTQANIAALLKEEIQVQRSVRTFEKRKQASKELRKTQRKKNKKGQYTSADDQDAKFIIAPTAAEIKKDLGARSVKMYYIGGSNSRGGGMGLWKRLANNDRRKMIYDFKRTQGYAAGTINLKDFWTREAGEIMDREFSKNWLSAGDRK